MGLIWSSSYPFRQVIDSFSYCGLEGVDMKNPEIEFAIFEDCASDYWAYVVIVR